MKLSQAIEILTELNKLDEAVSWLDIESAVGLGIEALKRLKYQREIWMPTTIDLLPGETEE